jgi:hypothetical protein
MAERFSVVLVDDGELDEVRDLLLELGIEFAHLRGGAVPRRLDPPRDLFVSSVRRAGLARSWPRSPDGTARPIRIAVAYEDSAAARSALRNMGFTYLVRPPIHPVALRLLLLRALYRGDERRSAVRVPVGVDVSLRSGLRRRDALLADLSRGGCRLVTERALPAGAKVTIHLPATLMGDDANLGLAGRILRCERDAHALLDGGFSIAVRFHPPSDADRQRLERMLSRRDMQLGPAEGDGARVHPLRTADAPAPEPTAPSPAASETKPAPAGAAAEPARSPGRAARPKPSATAPPEPGPQAPPARATPRRSSKRKTDAPLSRYAQAGRNAPPPGGEGASEAEAPPAPVAPSASAAPTGPQRGGPAPENPSEPGDAAAGVPRLGATLINRGKRRAPPPDRRRHPRAVYDRRVIAEAAAAMHRMLLGRDLGAGGMRVDHHPDLRVGARVRLALYDAAREAPLVVDAVVARDDGPHGFGLQFLGLTPELAVRLEAIVAGLPPVERLVDGESGALGTVLGEIVS